MSDAVLGIDLGTTNSVVAVLEGAEPVVVPNAEGGRTTPSVVALGRDGERLVGLLAKRQAITNPARTVYSIKRFMGRTRAEVQDEAARVPYAVVADAAGQAVVDLDGTRLSPPEVSAMILRRMRETAEAYLGRPVAKAVVTVPAYFNDAQRQATQDAGRIAGLDVLRIVNEPTAAALAYGLDRAGRDERVAVFDLGGGTYDVSILEMYDVEGTRQFEVKATNGDTHLGGDDFDQRIIAWMVAEFRRDQGVDLSQDPMARARLKEAAERAKIELSGTASTEINLPFVTADATGPKHLQLTLTRARFEELIDDLVQRTVGPMRAALADAGLDPEDVQTVLLVGGSTRIPKVQEAVRQVFGREPNRSMNPDEVVAVGAAIQGGVLTGATPDVLLLDVTPLSLGLETLGGVMTPLIPRNTTIPTRRTETFSTADDNQRTVDLRVLQGERPRAHQNRTLGRFQLTGIPPAGRGTPKIGVTFDLDANGILHVSARDTATGREQTVRIEAGGGLSEADIQRMVQESERMAEEDAVARDVVEARNALDALVYTVERDLGDRGEGMHPPARHELEAGLAAARDAARTAETPEQLRRATEQLRQTWARAGTARHAAEPPAAASPKSTASSGSGPEEPVEAEYEIVEEGGR